MRRCRLILPALLLCQACGFAQAGPLPPCGNDPVPPWPALTEPVNLKAWSSADMGRDWKPPACVGWDAAGFTTLVSTAARFRYSSDAEGLLRHIGAISALSGMRYWSTTHNRWQTLILEAHALTGGRTLERRKDFTPEEMKQGRILRFEQVDNLSGKSVYRLHVVESSASRIVYDVENVTTMRYLFIPVFAPGELQTIFFLDRESEGVWRYYSIMRIGRNVNRLMAGNNASAINRAAAFYRFLVGIPAPREPPGSDEPERKQ